MLGKIASFDPETGSGSIDSEGQNYPFELASWVDEVHPEAGDDVGFDLENGQISNISLVGSYIGKPKAVKYKYLAAVLSLVFGWAGIARFYLGFYKIGVYQIVLTVILVYAGAPQFPFMWGFIEAMLLASSKMDKDAKGRPLK